MSDNVIQFPKRQPAPPQVSADPVAVEHLSEQFLKQAVTMHMTGESGIDIYRGMIMSLCKLICRSGDDPAVIDRRLEASHNHLLEAREILASARSVTTQG